MKTGDILTWQTNGVAGKAIQVVTKSNKNHVGMVIRFREFDTEMVYTTEALAEGFCLASLSKRIRNHNGHCWWHPLEDVHDDKRKDMGRLALTYMRKGYDYQSLFAQIMGRVSVNAERLFCSEAIQVIAEDAGVLPYRTVAMQPKHFDTVDGWKTGVAIK